MEFEGHFFCLVTVIVYLSVFFPFISLDNSIMGSMQGWRKAASLQHRVSRVMFVRDCVRTMSKFPFFYSSYRQDLMS